MPYVITGDLDCHTWTGSCTKDGTPIIHARRGMTTARRYHYERDIGPIPKGKILYALCQNKLCVRPTHMEPVTQGELQARRGDRKLDRKLAASAMRMRATGVSLRKVGAAFGVSHTTIEAIEKGTHWTIKNRA